MFGGERYGKRIPSERESRVIELVAQGLKNKEVADEIGTTEHVVKNYLRAIYDKLGPVFTAVRATEVGLLHLFAHNADATGLVTRAQGNRA